MRAELVAVLSGIGALIALGLILRYHHATTDETKALFKGGISETRVLNTAGKMK